MDDAEDRKHSNHIMRRALPLMARQAPSFDGRSYALWYAHCAGTNPALSRALDAQLALRRPLSMADVRELYIKYIVLKELEEYEELRKELCRILEKTAADTEIAGEHAEAFDQAMAGYAERLARATETEQVRDAVADLRTDTGRMRIVTAELAQKLQARTEEVNALTARAMQAENKAAEAENKALRDALTGLLNRGAFDQTALEYGSLAGVALMMVDIDHFKKINDSHGHILGDKVLKAVAHVLKTTIRARDVAARLGGEEFGVLLPETSPSSAAVLARRICALVAAGRIKRSHGKGTIGQVTLSIGVAAGREGESLEQLMERADGALYQAKHSGRNRVELAPELP